MRTILLATDGSEDARGAATHALDLADTHGAELHVLCVVDQRRFDEPALSSAELAKIYAEDHADMCVNEVQDMYDGNTVRIRGETRYGLPHEVILDSLLQP